MYQGTWNEVKGGGYSMLLLGLRVFHSVNIPQHHSLFPEHSINMLEHVHPVFPRGGGCRQISCGSFDVWPGCGRAEAVVLGRRPGGFRVRTQCLVSAESPDARNVAIVEND